MCNSISEQEKQDITQKIDIYLKATFKDKIKRARAYISPFHSRSSKYFIVQASRNRFYDLYIRFNNDYCDEQKAIIIARIFFAKTQKKIGSRLLYELIQITKLYGYKYVMLESVNDNSRAFGKRLGFEAYNANLQDSCPTNQYFIPIDRLENFLERYLQT